MPDMPPRWPLVRPPRQAQGGGAAAPFGNSGAPGIPMGSTSRSLRSLNTGDERGRFTERVFVFPPFAGVVPGGDGQQSTIEVTSNRTGLMRLVALRGVILSATDPTPYDAANLKLRLQINGTEDFTTSGQQVNPVSFAILFANTAAPWWWYACPPRIKSGDMLQVTITNTLPGGEGANIMVPEVALRLVDDEYWQAYYGGG
jgi:hypothetical protein